MNFRKIFNRDLPKSTEPPQRVKITITNISQWVKFEKLFNEGKVKFDSKGRLRFLHGAPVGDMILIRINKNGQPVYKESVEEWFDPGGVMAKEFVWP